MIRVIVFLVLIGLAALGAAWLADRPGEVAITWQGYRIEASVMVAAAAVLLVAALAVLGWAILRFLVRSPDRVSKALASRRRRRGRQAIARGLIALGAGDARAAQRLSREAERVAPSDPLALLLRAQTAQLVGDRAGAESAFRAMAQRGDTKLLGLRGLYIEAQRHEDMHAARKIAEEAASSAPALPWAADAALQARCEAGDFEGALALVDANARSGLFDKATFRRRRAVLLTARALKAEETDRAAATGMALEAVRLAPDLVPAAALAGRLLAEAGETRRATKVLEAAWQAQPHPDLAEAYAHVRLSDSARQRLTRMKRLAELTPGHPEAALALTRAAIDAREFDAARIALAPLLKEPTQRAALLMAEIEDLEHGDEGRSREWTARALRARRDPAWTADGFVSERWLPLSPVTGRLDAFQWRVPVAEIASSRPADDEEDLLATIDARSEPMVAEVPQAPAPDAMPGGPRPSDPAAKSLAVPAPLKRVPETVIPLVHAPDDPGPEADLPDHAPAKNGGTAWQRLRLFFR